MLMFHIYKVPRSSLYAVCNSQSKKVNPGSDTPRSTSSSQNYRERQTYIKQPQNEQLSAEWQPGGTFSQKLCSPNVTEYYLKLSQLLKTFISGETIQHIWLSWLVALEI